MAIAVTGTNHIDALMLGVSWGGTTGVGRALQYAFSTDDGSESKDWMQAAVTAAFQQWANVANLTFTEVAFGDGATDIDFFHEDLNEVLGKGVSGVTFPYAAGSFLFYAEVGVDDVYRRDSDVEPGKAGFRTILHELGHALGLNHPGDYSGAGGGTYLPGSEDTTRATVMSYFEFVGKSISLKMLAPSGPMIYDIAAMQYLYGANTSYHSGDDVYTIAKATAMYTIWDGGGEDTLDGSLLSKAIIDLREGLQYFSTFGDTLIWNAFGANIEHALGSRGKDKFYGNALDNELTGQKGNDSILAGDGEDLVYGDDVGGLLKGKDTIYGEGGDDTIYGGLYADTIYGGEGNDLIYGDTVTYIALDKADFIDGGGDDDTMDGGGGADIFYFASGSGLDEIMDFEGEGIAGGDIIRLVAYGFATTLDVLAVIGYAGTDATITLSGSDSILVHGVNTPFIASDFLVS